MSGLSNPSTELRRLIALNNEILALSRAGLPLSRGLFAVSSGVRGPLARITNSVKERINRGESLEQALSDPAAGIPAVYRAVVRAGLRSGNLPAALERLAIITNEYSESRRAIGLAILYPLTVLIMGYGLLLITALVTAPRMVALLDNFGLPRAPVLSALIWIGGQGKIALALPPILLVLLGLAWMRSGSSGAMGADESLRVLGPGWFFGLGGLLRKARAAAFSDILALLLEHDVPFDEAIELSGRASGDPRLSRAASAAAERARQGEAPLEAMKAAGAFPMLLVWLGAVASSRAHFVAALKGAALIARRDAIARADAIRMFVPLALVLLIGATAALAYASILYIPFGALLNEMAIPT